MKSVDHTTKYEKKFSHIVEDDRGFRSVFFIEHEGFEWFVRMRNGEVTRIKKLWEIEE